MSQILSSNPILPTLKNINQRNRQIFVDTETTGIKPSNGDRIIELGMIELINGKFTGEKCHLYINPKRKLEAEAIAIHGITDEFLKDQPTFADLAQTIYDFINDAEIIAHNSGFDLAFLTAEFERAGFEGFSQKIHDRQIVVTDTLAIAKNLFPTKPNDVESLCKRLKIDISGGNLPSSFLDAMTTAEIYLAINALSHKDLQQIVRDENKFFKDKQDQINEFLTKANAALPNDNPMYFDGRFITGRINNPDILFLGINPGHGDWGSLENRKKFTKQIPFEELPCKYIDGFTNKEALAKRIVNIICDDDISKLDNCAETSYFSYFATPDVKVLKAQLNALPKHLKKEHQELIDMQIIEEVKPKNIVCIGLRAFNDLTKLYPNAELEEIKSVPSKSGKTIRTYYKRSSIGQIPVHGLIHLSGAHPSNEMLEDIKEIMLGVWF